MRHTILAMTALMLFSVCAAAQTQFGIDDWNGTGVKVANDELGDNFAVIHVQFAKPNNKHITLKLIVYGEYRSKLWAVPIGAYITGTGTHIWKQNIDGKPELLIRLFEFDWFKDKTQ